MNVITAEYKLIDRNKVFIKKMKKR